MKTAWIGKTARTKIGSIWVGLSEVGLVGVSIQASQSVFIQQIEKLGFQRVVLDQERTAGAVLQIEEYLKGSRQHFDLKIDWSVMSSFQEAALKETCRIPYGQTSTYGMIAHQLGRPRSARAVGRAEATNPMPLVIPCHRVLGADGGLHGYGAPGGLKTKAWLLDLEGAIT